MRQFRMKPEELEKNIRQLSYHRQYVAGAQELRKIRRDKSMPAGEKRKRIIEIREGLEKLWEGADD